ncbi:MAG: transcription antitermination factor NusB [Beijerinckiaceae bacterium]|nr:transcription antitermination factor NusB [Beijerinckiaceae bacterium]
MARGDLRSAARLAAVQALYQMDLGGKPVGDVIAEHEAHWIGREIDGIEMPEAEESFFRAIVEGVVADQVAIDRAVDDALAKGWPLKRIEAVLRAILRAGVFELKNRPDVPLRVIVSEYMRVTDSFYTEQEPAMVNAVLDAIARDIRAGERG